ncbi:phage major capsid protein [Bacillus anthracis]|nr:phage major capsid protein [Bacillus anthracis]PFR03836.1 phage major capsid protein [Bacillus anthracis]
MKINKQNNDLQEFLKDGELRSLQAGTNGAPLVPTEIAQEMIKKVSEQSGIFGKAKQFTTTGKLDIVVEDKIGEAEILEEGLDITDVDPEFHVETLDTKRVGASIKMTKKMVHNSAVDIEGYATDNISRRIAQKLENEALNGKTQGKNSFKGLYASVPAKEIELTAEKIIDMVADLPTVYAENAEFVVNRGMLKKLLQLKNTDGDFRLVDFVQGFGYQMLGLPISVSEFAKDGVIALVNCQEALATLVGPEITIDAVSQDEKNRRAGTVTVIGDLYADMLVVNPEAVRVMAVKSTTTAKKAA